MPKYATVAFDSLGELARLFFTKSMGKSSSDTEKIRMVNDYAPATERLNMLVRRLKNLRDQGTEVVFMAHEDIQKTYARGGAIAARGQTPSEPIEVKGQPDIPGNVAPNEFMRASDIVWRIRLVNKKPMCIARQEPLASGNDYWVAKDRFNGKDINGGMFPLDYNEIAKIVKPTGLWNPCYIWILFGMIGIGKTRSLLTFPRPLYMFNTDRGAKSIPEAKNLKDFTIDDYDVEEIDEYDRFMGNVAKLF